MPKQELFASLKTSSRSFPPCLRFGTVGRNTPSVNCFHLLVPCRLPDRMFLRRLIDLSTISIPSVSALHHHITMDAEARADIQWWLDFLPSWNGVAIIQSEPVTSVSLRLFTDASGLGFGAVYGDEWFREPWPPACKDLRINVQELFAIVAAVFTWGHRWIDSQILFFTDNLIITHV